MIGIVVLISGIIASHLAGVSYIIGCAPGIGIIAFQYYLKKSRDEKIRGRIEKELPMTLREIATSLEASISLNKAVENVAKSKSEIGGELRKVIKERNAGVPLPIALSKSAERIDSPDYSMAINQLVLIYKSGQGVENLRKIARGIQTRQRIEMKNFSGKMTMYSLILIGVSSILPALFQSYLTIGSIFMNIELKPIEALLIPSIGFPILDLMIILMIRMKKPRFAW